MEVWNFTIEWKHIPSSFLL